MADKFAGGVKADSSSVSVVVVLRDKTDNTELTGKIASAMSFSFWRQGALVTDFTGATLASVDGNYAAGGWAEVNSSKQPGIYRLDVPNSAWSAGAEWVVVAAKTTANSAYVFYERYALETLHLNNLNNLAYADVKSAACAALGSFGAVVYADVKSAASQALGSFGAVVYADVKSAASQALGSFGAVVYADVKSAASQALGSFGAVVYVDVKSAASEALKSHGASTLVYADIKSAASQALGSFGAVVYADVKSAASQALGSFGAVNQADVRSAASLAIGAFAPLTDKANMRLSVLGVEDITKYTKTMPTGFPGSSPAAIDAQYWVYMQNGYKRVQQPTSYVLYDADNTTKIASATISGTSSEVVIGKFS